MMRLNVVVLLLSLTACANNPQGGAVVGGAIGGAAGATVGYDLGGRAGSVIGGALGSAAGVILGSDASRADRPAERERNSGSDDYRSER